jgi:hypothetical protein
MSNKVETWAVAWDTPPMAETAELASNTTRAGSPSDPRLELDRLLLAARRARVEILAENARIVEQASLQGRADAFASVTGLTSLERGAAELADLIAELEGRTEGRGS